MFRLIATTIVAALMLSTTGNAVAGDRAAPQAVEKVLLENDKVQVLEIYFKPGAVHKMREREPRVVYYITDAHFTVTAPGGTSTARSQQAGTAAWRGKETIEVTNTGKEDVRIVVTYLK
jgi:hypothetical protein